MPKRFLSDGMVISLLPVRMEKDPILFDEARKVLKKPDATLDEMYKECKAYIERIGKTTRQLLEDEVYNQLYDLLEESFLRQIPDNVNYAKGKYYEVLPQARDYYTEFLEIQLI